MLQGLPLEGVTVELQKAIRGLYDAVAMPETWAAAMHSYARATNSVGCVFYPRQQAQALAYLPVSPDIAEFIDAYVKERWYTQDVRAIRGWPVLANSSKRVFTDDDFTTPEERRASPYFQDFHRDWELPNWAAISFNANGGLWAMSLLRSERQGSISKRQADMLSIASPHLGHVIELATLVGQRRMSEQLELLHRSNRAAALLDWRGNVVGLTPRAEAMLGSSLYTSKGRLLARELASNIALQRAIDAIITPRPRNGSDEQTVAIARQNRRPIIIRVIGLMGTLIDVFGQARGLLLFNDLEERSRSSIDLLRDLFGLTRAEARLVTELASGGPLNLIADRLNITTGTARIQLKSAFRKAGVHKQSEMVALLSKLSRE